MFFDELASRGNLVAHQHREYAVGFGSVVDGYFAQNPGVWVHRGFPQLMGVHFTETFVALDVYALAHFGRDLVTLLLRPAIALLLALFTRNRGGVAI